MKLILPIAFLLTGTLQAQQPPAGPPPVPCGLHGDVEILCGTRSPEDLELTPDGNYLIVSQFVNGRGGTGAGLVLFNLAKKTYGKLAITSEPKKAAQRLPRPPNRLTPPMTAAAIASSRSVPPPIVVSAASRFETATA